MSDYRAMDKTGWFIRKMKSGWFTRQEVVEAASYEFPDIPLKTLEGTIGQYWSDSVNPKWPTFKAIEARGLKTIEQGRKRQVVTDDSNLSSLRTNSRIVDPNISSIRSKEPHAETFPHSASRIQLIEINDAFIGKWHPKYDETECDEDEYQSLVVAVARDIDSDGTISKETFLRIWKWKKAIRTIGDIVMDEYDTRYADAFRRILSESVEKKLSILLAPGLKLPGVGAPSGSTLIHFMHPDIMPIIDVRTVEVLFKAGLISTKQRDLYHYEEFRLAIDGIRVRNSNWTLRQLDRALFAYHKQILDKNSKVKRLQCA